jgi:hypothetical protein
VVLVARECRLGEVVEPVEFLDDDGLGRVSALADDLHSADVRRHFTEPDGSGISLLQPNDVDFTLTVNEERVVDDTSHSTTWRR